MKTTEHLIDKREVLELASRKLDNQRKRLGIIESKRDIQLAQKKIIMEQIAQLKELLTEEVIDVERTIFGNEPVYKPLLDNDEIIRIKAKIWKLLVQL